MFSYILVGILNFFLSDWLSKGKVDEKEKRIVNRNGKVSL